MNARWQCAALSAKRDGEKIGAEVRVNLVTLSFIRVHVLNITTSHVLSVGAHFADILWQDTSRYNKLRK